MSYTAPSEGAYPVRPRGTHTEPYYCYGRARGGEGGYGQRQSNACTRVLDMYNGEAGGDSEKLYNGAEAGALAFYAR
jgi:hypothetical protein